MLKNTKKAYQLKQKSNKKHGIFTIFKNKFI